jgi:hypothetical protein
LLDAFCQIKVDSSFVATEAGTILPEGNDPGLWTPPGIPSNQNYTTSLPCGALAESGTAVQGLIAAMDMLSGGHYQLVPVYTDWTGQTVMDLLQLCQAFPDWQAVPLANLQTGHLWGSRLPLNDAIAHLQGESIAPPPPDWDVGHFLSLAGLVRGLNALVLVGDTYPQFGWYGYHLQPVEAIATALNRSDGNQGGILLGVRSDHVEGVKQQVTEQGWAIAAWDNGTPQVSQTSS